MFTILKDYLFLIVAAIALFAVGVFGVQKYNASRATERAVSAEAAATSHQTYAAEYKEYVQKKEVRNEQVEAILKANPVWSAEPLPDDVSRILQHPSGSTEAVP